jgi:hypothetical protein
MPATTGFYPEVKPKDSHTFACSTIGPAVFNFRVVARFAPGCRNLNYQALADILSLSRAFGTFVILPSRIR